ncbi:hypothetical protein [Candidatus Parabeggiatoa sp. HSG14]|uniref:WD40 repeat domain-containing protein n=1 Tax=Candidatus Parabeggiatoa sp. HSG14 TaxID=3055593 RepID=UPI0025A7638D|nr:hypothetical protein [Thiotrichales bacterium HSG14]
MRRFFVSSPNSIEKGDANQGILLALEAWYQYPLFEAQDQLYKAVLKLSERLVMRHTENVFSAFFSPDSQYIITASDDDTARLWENQSGKALKTLKGHQGNV